MYKRSIAAFGIAGMALASLIFFSTANFAWGRRAASGSTSSSSTSTTNRIAVCWTAPQTATSSEPENTTNYGIVLTLEPYNGSEISANTYLLDSNFRKVKLVGHAEVMQETGTSASGTILSVTSADDSPSAFSFSIGLDSSNTAGLEGTLDTAVLFTGEALTNQIFKCHMPNWMPDTSAGQAE